MSRESDVRADPLNSLKAIHYVVAAVTELCLHL